MDKLIRFFASFCFLALLAGCKKETQNSSDIVVSIQVIHGVVDLPSLMLKMNGSINASGFTTTNRTNVTYGASAYFYAEGKPTTVDFLKATDSSVLLSANYELKKSGKYTLLLAGQLPAVEAVLIEESNYPFVAIDKIPGDADSVINIRFVNLSPNAGPIKVNIQGSPINEVIDLAYKVASNFKAYGARVANTSYKFEFRDALTNALLFASPTTVIVSTANRFKNQALVLRGLRGTTTGTNALTVSTVNYFH